MGVQTTKDMNFINGKYADERVLIHDEILKKSLDDLQQAHEKPLVIFLGGGSASGKSSISKMLIQTFRDEGEDVILIDSDKIKTMLPEYKQLIERDPEHAAAVLHDESSDISEILYSRSLEKKVNILFDGTMKNAEKYERLIREARAQNYSVSAVIADVPLEEAYRRADIRFEIEKRRVPREVIKQSHEGVPRTFNQLKDKFDSFYLYDTSKRHPIPFYVKDDGIQIEDEQRLAEFYAKAGNSIDYQKWIQPEHSKKLVDVLKMAKGLPDDNSLTAELLNRTVERYAITKINGKEVVSYSLKGCTEVSSIQLRSLPHLSAEAKNLLLDQASLNVGYIKNKEIGLEL